MKTTTQLMAGMLLLTMASATLACEPRPGQAAMDAMREQALAELRGDNLASLKPSIERNLIAAVRSAAPRHMVAAGTPMPASGAAATPLNGWRVSPSFPGPSYSR